MIRVLVLATFFGAAAFASPASAQAQDVPLSCANASTTPGATGNRFTEMMYNSGTASGLRITEQAWDAVDDCTEIDRFVTIVSQTVDQLAPTNPSPFTICRYTGMADGIFEGLDALYGACGDTCFLDGLVAGEFAGQVYCELSIMLGGLSVADDFIRGPVQLCGASFQIGCDSAFIGTTLTYANDFGACAPFTLDTPPDGLFFDVWDQTRNNQCIFEVPEDEPLSSADDETLMSTEDDQRSVF